MRNKGLPKPLLTVMMAIVLGLAAFVVTGCGDDDETAAAPEATSETAMSEMDIVETASGNEDLSTLVELVTAADLVETLQGPGPFTVFAPTDEAFAKLPKGTVEDLLKPENKAKLIAVLTYHVIPAKAMAADVVKLDGKKVKSVQGSEIAVSVVDGGVLVNKAKVVKTDIECKNGVIHVIDAVILPPSE